MLARLARAGRFVVAVDTLPADLTAADGPGLGRGGVPAVAAGAGHHDRSAARARRAGGRAGPARAAWTRCCGTWRGWPTAPRVGGPMSDDAGRADRTGPGGRGTRPTRVSLAPLLVAVRHLRAPCWPGLAAGRTRCRCCRGAGAARLSWWWPRCCRRSGRAGSWPTFAALVTVGGWLLATDGLRPSRSRSWRLLAVAALLYLAHTLCALAALLPYDAVVDPELIAALAGRGPAAVVLASAVARRACCCRARWALARTGGCQAATVAGLLVGGGSSAALLGLAAASQVTPDGAGRCAGHRWLCSVTEGGLERDYPSRPGKDR